jgi:Na+-driven multidrug efflux pump
VKEGFRAGQRLLAGFGLFMSLVMLGGAEPCLRLVLPAGDAAALGPAMGYLRLVACFYLFNILGSGQAGYFRGRGWVNIPVIGATGHISLRAALSFLLAPAMGLPAVALATGLGWIGVVSFWGILTRRDRM